MPLLRSDDKKIPDCVRECNSALHKSDRKPSLTGLIILSTVS
jgi:hypothetical protein